jgi:hypothetical protein
LLGKEGSEMARKIEHKAELYDEQTLKLGIRLYEKGELPLELFYHMLSLRRLNSFSVIMIQAVMEDFGTFLKDHKRKSDLLFKLDASKGIYAIFCQETQVDGGYYFLQRLAKDITEKEAVDLRACIVGVESTKYPIHDLLFIILDSFVKVRDAEEKEDKIHYRTIK